MFVSSNTNGVFTPTNPTCPIVSYSLLNDGDGLYNMVDLNPGYEIQIGPEYTSTVGTYPDFEIQATAAGGAIATATGYMRVGPPEYDCQPMTLNQPDSFEFFVP